MANRRFQPLGGRRMEFGRNDRNKNFGRVGVSPWQGGGPGVGLPNLLPLAGGSTEATTLALATNIINLLQPRQNPVPSLLDMPIRRDFSPNMGRFDRNFGPNRMGNQGNFRRTGNYNRAGERIYTNRKPFRPNDGPRQQNKSSPKKEADSKAKPVNESEQEVKSEHENEETSESKEGGEGKTEQVKTRYDHIDPQLLKCHICNKSMWDALSFENHVRGRAHAIMMQKTAESYALTADTMRQEFKIREIKRARRSGEKPTRDFYCAMCDMYASDGAAHRTNPGHRKLKKYLHPPCTVCHLEMPNRIELEQHRLTPEHLKTIQDKQGQVPKPRPEVMVISTMNMEQLYVREDRHRWRYGEQWEDRRYEATDRANQPDAEIKQENEGEGETQTETEVKKEQSPELDSENTILDYKEGDDLSNVTKEMFPAYSTERGVGESFLAELACVQCKLCNKVLDDAATAQVHLRTWRHHQLFTRLLAERCPAPVSTVICQHGARRGRVVPGRAGVRAVQAVQQGAGRRGHRAGAPAHVAPPPAVHQAAGRALPRAGEYCYMPARSAAWASRSWPSWRACSASCATRCWTTRPPRSTERGVGESFLAELACVQCKLCNKVLDDAATAQVHLRTWRHHQLFTRLLAERCPAPVSTVICQHGARRGRVVPGRAGVRAVQAVQQGAGRRGHRAGAPAHVAPPPAVHQAAGRALPRAGEYCYMPARSAAWASRSWPSWRACSASCATRCWTTRPPRSTERGVGESFLAELACVQCKLCNKVLDDAATAQVHLRTWRHHQLFTRLLAERCPAPVSTVICQHGARRGRVVPGRAGVRAVQAVQQGAGRRGHRAGAPAHVAPPPAVHQAAGRALPRAEEPCNDTVAEESAGIDEMLEENDGDMAMPPADQLDDWEQSVDEILEDEMNRSNNVKSPEPEPEPEPTSEIKHEKPESPEKVPEPKTPARATPRGRPRGRGRARGRY
ncbi:hypothetical protein ACJJTC_006791 [Scirpophaga incertulas]